ncbi:MAG: histidinol dehydrogenase [Lachnospiraceae bacterium]|nr:histidinol dehydrogenase [Lachnospiraceae bacterium]
MIKTYKYGEIPNEEIFARESSASGVEGIVAQIIADVINRGDEALFEYCRKFDKAELTSLQVTPEEMDEACSEVEPEFIEILEKAAANIRAFHEKQKREGFVIEDQDGIVLGQKIIPIEKAGLYVPGGTAAYPSTVLMDAIPAKIAGCSEIVIVSPPNSEGRLNPAILAAARVAGVDRIFKVGGAQAIAALAYGTESIPKVDKIVGPGNAFVAEAKKQVFGKVSIDMIAGPSEILVVADCLSDASIVAADMLSQAEHDKMASAVLVTDSETLAAAVSAEIERQIPLLDRAEIARASIDTNGKIIIVHNIDEAIDITNEIAPEHLELSVDNAFELLNGVKNAGSVFLGRSCPEALGDYFAGSNHTLPTSGTARFSSPLSVDDFIKKSQFIYYSEDALDAVAEDVAAFARKEGLTGHARSALIRGEAKK